MKLLLIILLVLGYTAIGVFGVFGMHTETDMNMQGHDMATSNCIAASAKGINCPKEVNPIDFIAFHLNAFKSFSLVTFGENVLFFLLALIFLGIGIGVHSLLGNAAYPRLALAYCKHRNRQFNFYSKKQLLRWLALHENSPALF